MRSCGAVDLQSGWLGEKKELKSQFCLLLSIDLAALSDEFGSSTWMYFPVSCSNLFCLGRV